MFVNLQFGPDSSREHLLFCRYNDAITEMNSQREETARYARPVLLWLTIKK